MTEAGDAALQVKSDTIATGLAAIVAGGAEAFDPVRYRYIESMAAHAQTQKKAVARVVEQRALEALAAYSADLACAREEAQIIVSRVSATHPDSTAQLQTLFERCDFKGIKQLAARLERSTTRARLSELTGQLVRSATPDEPGDHSFDAMMREQEQAIADDLPSAAGPLGELKALRSFRKSRERISIDKLITRCINECPEDCGPLNPQMLAIRSLVVMRELSPQYLNRFVGYIDTLLWLEQAEEKNAAPDTASSSTSSSPKRPQKRGRRSAKKSED